VLHLYGEHEYVVAPMPVPIANLTSGAAEAASVQLFCERAQAARADFCLTPGLALIVAEICRRLDGLPLAIELAAARIKIFSPQELLQRLDRRLPLLTQGPADLPPHDQVLENAIAWSYGLLSPSERTLLNRLAVFYGGFTLAAAEAICVFPTTTRGNALELPDSTSSLVALLDQSLLLRQQGGAPTAESRFLMLETIREFVQERLRESGELDVLQRRHGEYFTGWAEHAEYQLCGPDQGPWLTNIELEFDNLRAVLSWSLDTGQIEMAARMVCALAVFWRRRGHLSEGRRWLERVLPHMLPGIASVRLRAKTLQAAGSLAYRQGDWSPAQGWLKESLVLYQSCGDQTGTARVLFDLGWIAIDQGDWIEAARLNQASLELAREVDDRPGIYRALTNLGWTRLCTGEQDEAAAFFAEAYELSRHGGHTKGMAVSLANLGWIALARNNLALAAAQAKESLKIYQLLGEKELLAECLEILVVVALREGDNERAARLSGASHAIWKVLHVSRSPTQYSAATHAEAVAALQRELSGGVFSSIWQQGREMSLESVVELALGISY
jgi:predicted ATPase